jgi:heat shock protein HslJ
MPMQLPRPRPERRIACHQVPGVHAAPAHRPSLLRTAVSVAAVAFAGFVAGCTMPTHPDSAAPPTDPYNPAATQLLDDTRWNLTSWTDASGGQARALPQDSGTGAAITLNFSTETGKRKVNGFSGCNRYTGTYDLKNGKLAIGPLAGTRMACAPGPGAALEQPYLAGLASIEKTGVQMRPPQQLQITLDNGDVLMFTQHRK